VGDEVTSVTLRRGERTSVRLPGLGTAGYRWTSEVEGDGAAVSVSLTTAPAEEVAGRPPGASVDEVAVVEARQAGHATVVLHQSRSWENGPPHARRVLEVTVT
jgi:predicted secreted protein